MAAAASGKVPLTRIKHFEDDQETSEHRDHLRTVEPDMIQKVADLSTQKVGRPPYFEEFYARAAAVPLRSSRPARDLGEDVYRVLAPTDDSSTLLVAALLHAEEVPPLSSSSSSFPENALHRPAAHDTSRGKDGAAANIGPRNGGPLLVVAPVSHCYCSSTLPIVGQVCTSQP